MRRDGTEGTGGSEAAMMKNHAQRGPSRWEQSGSLRRPRSREASPRALQTEAEDRPTWETRAF